MNPKYKEKAIPLISVDQATGKYNLTAQANEFLRSVPSPIGVVSVAGLYRTGKSYLLNQMLLNRSNGFGVGPTVNPCTKGLWCWGTPIKGETPEGQKLNIIVIDTEGIGALDEDQTHDTRIFTLAILSSSCFIYNSQGSIDENAVQNLSLVVNLTKHIQLRTSKSGEEEDPEKIASHFPTFFWVVRDFTLQMVDSEGNKLSSKQYLQKALAPHKGFSDDVEEKNRIRRMLTSFFKDRDCFTLVRPLIDETKLQDLDKMSFQDLRPQFVNQVINFRKRVTGRMKPKTLNGQKLSGQLYLNMLSSYVGAINDGAVPNIENAWNYMCQQQCSKVMAQSLETFDRQLKQIRIPCSNQEITKGLETAQEAAFQTFKTKSIGQDSQKYLKQLQAQMRAKGRQLKRINADQGKEDFKKYIAPFVSPIQQKISKGQYTSNEQFLDQLNKFQEKISKQGPNYVDANLNLHILMKKVTNQGILFLSKRMKNEKQQIKKTLEERIKLTEQEIQNLRKEREGQQSSTKQRISLMDKQKVDMMFKLEKLQYELERSSKERSSEEQILTKNLNAKKAEMQQLKKQLDLKMSEANTKVQQMTKTLHFEQNNWEKQRAVLDLRVKQQVERIQQLQKKRQTFDSKLALQTNELSQKHRQQTMKLQEQIQDLMKNLSQTKEKHQEMTTKYNDLTDKYTGINQKYESIQRKLRQQTSSKMRQIERIKNQHESELNRIKNQLSHNQDEKTRQGKQLEQKFKKQEIKTKELSEQLKNTKGKYERQNQILTQQLEFAKRNFEQTKQKLTEMKAIYQSRIAAIQQDNGLQRQEQVKRKIAELKSGHQEDLRNAENQFKENVKNLNFQIENLTKIRNELELKLKVNTEQLTNQRTENEQTKKNLVYKTQQLQNEIKQMTREKSTQLIAKEGLYSEKLATLERELEETRENYHAQKMDLQTRAGNQITQIKNYYQMEREKQQSRHSQQKDKLKKKYTKTVEQYERKLQQESDNYQQELERIESQYGNEIRTLTMTLNQITHQKDTLSREKVSLQDRLNALNQKYAKMEFQLSDRLQKMIDASKAEKQTLLKKNEELQQIKNEMQKQLLSLTHERDQFRNQTQKQASQIEQFKYQNASLTQRFETTKKTLQQKLKQVQGNYMRDKSKFQTDVALLQQKKDFAEQKIAELETDLKSTKQREQEQLRQVKQKYQQQINNLTLKNTNEKKIYEQKLEKLKKQSADTQSTLSKQLSQISKAKAVDEQKIEYLEKKVIQSESKRQVEVDSLNEQLKTLREKTTLQRTQLRARIEELEESLHIKQSDLTQQKNQYQIQIALADSKIKTHVQWSESTIAQKIETIKNLERQLDDSRKRNENEKSSQQLTHQQILTRMQSKYRNEITQLNQDVTKKTQQNEYMVKEHDRIIKDLNEKLAVERQTRASLETKVARVQNDYIIRQTKLTADIDKLRMEKQNMNSQMQRQIAREKQNYKAKIQDYERRINETDKVKQQALFQKQKQQAKWRMEKNILQQKLDELRENLEKQKNDAKRLVKDNEKLKAEKKKNSSFINIKNHTTFLGKQVSVENKQNSQVQ